MRKLNEFIYNLFQRVGTHVMKIIFAISGIILVLFLAMGTIIPELNRHVYEGKIVEKYAKNHTMTTGTTRYIVIQQGQTKTTIENNDILLHGKFNSKDIQQSLREGQKVKVYTIGFDAPKFGMHPNLYHIE
ncbi:MULTISPECIES: hypothetical protein [unclassified Staphylococcus]|uniref:hypothetical protein n=1 Tax=unclassified Staphylococcus TaxID=91994 RepID=UPI0021D1AFF4|nr:MULTISPECIES: hypothetical protein [unclassified Staphylococcus]UXR69434.1 hypothetical protein MUA26_09985 [Staphylococcus sp. IVB6246]UXR71489.1 hypothetical protein MUA88_10005 [Staphylococcus sp. IVB6240]UXR73767.1 hypothetical protein MUA48_10505 [Staphylococcus sp. IVB6238]UXR76087.1 hypothetical protein MUA74_10605 [Staphylococcus sp. IVB6233]UXR80285.1 hypothetical protein MUA65_10210 [Staphylococcus sp. IVB6218]